MIRGRQPASRASRSRTRARIRGGAGTPPTISLASPRGAHQSRRGALARLSRRIATRAEHLVVRVRERPRICLLSADTWKQARSRILLTFPAAGPPAVALSRDPRAAELRNRLPSGAKRCRPCGMPAAQLLADQRGRLPFIGAARRRDRPHDTAHRRVPVAGRVGDAFGIPNALDRVRREAMLSGLSECRLDADLAAAPRPCPAHLSVGYGSTPRHPCLEWSHDTLRA